MSKYDPTILQTKTMNRVIILLNEILNTPQNTKQYRALRKKAKILNAEYVKAKKQSGLNRWKYRD